MRNINANQIKVLSPEDSTSNQEVGTVPPDPEVPEKPVRRKFTAAYKLDILRQADVCTETGSIGELLRREGLYSSHLTDWRHQREEGTLKALTPKQRGRKSTHDPLTIENEQLRKENARLTKRLKQAELIIDVQKKTSQLLGLYMENENESN